MSSDFRMKIEAVATFASQGKCPLQEDAVLANRERGVFVVADGFGGAGAGDQASKIACEAVMDFLKREAGDEEATFPFISKSYYTLAGNVVFNAVVHANRKLMQLNRRRHVFERGGASVLAAYLDGSWFAMANAGLCSAWLLRDGRWTELARSRGYLKSLDPYYEGGNGCQDVPLMSLGTHRDVEPEIVEFRAQKGDLVALHTDGLGTQFRPVFDGILLQRGRAQDPLSTCVQQLGGLEYDDNSSGLFIYF